MDKNKLLKKSNRRAINLKRKEKCNFKLNI